MLSELRGLIEQARTHVARTANATLTMLYWRVGHRIRVDVLKNERAEYGAEILATLSQELARDYGKGFNVSALTRTIRETCWTWEHPTSASRNIWPTCRTGSCCPNPRISSIFREQPSSSSMEDRRGGLCRDFRLS
ncbi:MAG: hypothetical protein HUU04_07595, partial [Verrucomicrobiae bacterium]|nr:hypothetical protein [Verrucomicrobiae bacterium]